MSPITFWQNAPSIHQKPLIKALARKWDGDITVIVERNLSDHRKNQGWERPDYSPATLIVEPSRSERKQHLQETDSPDSVQFFSGLQAYPETYWTLKQATDTDAELGVLLEAGRPNDGIKSHLRKLQYSVHGLRWQKYLDYVLVMGELGIQWYQSCYFPQSILQPWGYFVEPAVGSPSEEYIEVGGKFTIAFVGSVIRRKGIDLLIQALAQLDKKEWTLVVIGEGPLKSEMKSLASGADISSQIKWVGTLDAYTDVRATMRSSDLVILPSRYDGWGAVVNEALHEGTPVITTRTCGATDLITHEMLGTVVPPKDDEALASAIKDRIRSGPVNKSQRTKIQTWADESISPSAGAEYLIGILDSTVSSEPPWRRSDNLGIFDE